MRILLNSNISCIKGTHASRRMYAYRFLIG